MKSGNEADDTFQTERKKPFLIGVAGGTASGKTSVCHAIIKEIMEDPDVPHGSVKILAQDAFYTDLSDRPKDLQLAHQGQFNFDHPDAFDFDLFHQSLSKLRDGCQSIEVPTYSFLTHSRTGVETFTNADVIIVEGILVLYNKEIREMFDWKFFVDCDADTRLARRVLRDVEERGRSCENVISQYVGFVKPAFEEFCLPTKKYVDIIFPKGQENHVAISMIAQHIHDLLGGKVQNRLRRSSEVKATIRRTVCSNGNGAEGWTINTEATSPEHIPTGRIRSSSTRGENNLGTTPTGIRPH